MENRSVWEDLIGIAPFLVGAAFMLSVTGHAQGTVASSQQSNFSPDYLNQSVGIVEQDSLDVPTLNSHRNKDHGSWVGLRMGLQASGGPISERWTVLAVYEYRMKNAMSFPIEFQVIARDPKNLPLLSLGLKLRTEIAGISTIYAQGGFSFGVPSGFAYGFGCEFFSSKSVCLSLDLKRTVGYYHFLTIGVAIRPFDK